MRNILKRFNADLRKSLPDGRQETQITQIKICDHLRAICDHLR